MQRSRPTDLTILTGLLQAFPLLLMLTTGACLPQVEEVVDAVPRDMTCTCGLHTGYPSVPCDVVGRTCHCFEHGYVCQPNGWKCIGTGNRSSCAACDNQPPEVCGDRWGEGDLAEPEVPDLAPEDAGELDGGQDAHDAGPRDLLRLLDSRGDAPADGSDGRWRDLRRGG